MKKRKKRKIVKSWDTPLDIIKATKQADNPSGRPPKKPLPKRWQKTGIKLTDTTREWNRKARR